MTTHNIKKLVKELTKYEYIAVRKGTGSMRGTYNIYSSINDSQSFKPFEEQLRSLFNVEIFSHYTVTIKA